MASIVNEILADPKRYAIAFLYFAVALFIILAGIGICVKMMGNPVTHLVNKLFTLLPFVMKELKGKAGIAGIVNLMIVSATLILAFVALLSPSLLTVLTFDSNNNKPSSLLIIMVAGVVFVISLLIVANSDKTFRLLKR